MGFFSFLFSQPAQSQPRPVKGVVRHNSPSPKVVRNGVRHVRRDTTPLFQQRGWKQSGNKWRGSYSTSFGTWDGKIEKHGDVFDVMIKKPPAQIQNHSKWQCFSKRKNGWFNIHLHDNPVDGDVSAVILYVERMLTEALKK
ncbi:MAG: hypothetical protein ACRBCJ_11160 [Hyphomicrobiaceae bacterium]